MRWDRVGIQTKLLSSFSKQTKKQLRKPLLHTIDDAYSPDDNRIECDRFHGRIGKHIDTNTAHLYLIEQCIHHSFLF